jgi:hypothetical protein
VLQKQVVVLMVASARVAHVSDEAPVDPTLGDDVFMFASNAGSWSTDVPKGWSRGRAVRAEPFEAVELDRSVLWSTGPSPAELPPQ